MTDDPIDKFICDVKGHGDFIKGCYCIIDNPEGMFHTHCQKCGQVITSTEEFVRRGSWANMYNPHKLIKGQ